ncbi:glycine--tRNA ligase subunit beta [Buchnera aphidicola (Hyadaphis tataricae)]|uniref:Glycine--tRNA ligase beta subunit n=1 Tax=Buchnera aphidicola (Hyadaphis tataricae) TaxID=1241859 RepID=A0A4D6Y612_9GAMM|nr:glycine--tRNA ligase subunit beta [Buchnera aphidicola]QCI21451.1 glycine--tRNA ligase subunit beta [Buchnera aphidicola (Hyadaphis tataricae)]
MTKKTLLIEIGTEELPAKSLSTISFSFYNNFIKKLNFYNILYKKIESFFTPRRIALKVLEIDTSDRISIINKKGPSLKKAYDQHGIPTETANRWAKHWGINICQAHRLKNTQGEWLVHQIKQKQKKIDILLPKMIEESLKEIIILKSMRWNITNRTFVRPIRNVVILLDDKVIEGRVFDIKSCRLLQNHLSNKEKKIKINYSQEYPLILFQKNKIIADYDLRKKTIINNIHTISKKINGFINNDNCLINEITDLVESPTALLGNFEKTFLCIPKKILIYVIEKQQKCFSIHNAKNNLLPCFIFISNIHTQSFEKIIISGYEKVMNARLSDANFFLQNDRKKHLVNYLIALKNIVFQKNLGSLYNKTIRLQIIIRWISQYIKFDKKHAARATLLSKCDLATDMVYEFPELQGIVGMHYALEDQEKKDVALALEEQYLPSFSKDELPKTIIGSVLSIADKIDTISGMFFIKNIPTANKDPFALRRLSIGILRIIIKQHIPIDLKDLIKKSLALHHKKCRNNILYNQIIDFFMIRLFHWYKEQGYEKKIVKSVLSSKSTNIIDMHKKIQDLSLFFKDNNASRIMLSIKRISNILDKENYIISSNINIKLIQEKEEIILFNQIKKFSSHTLNLFLEKKYKEILLQIKILEKPIDIFFEKIKVYHTNLKIRQNRLILLNILMKILSKITNFSYLY